MKKYFVLLILLIMPKLLIAQVAGGHVIRPTRKQQTTETKTNKENNNKKKDNAFQRNERNSRAATSSQKKVQNEPNHEVEAAGYDVTFSCNVPSASMSIDGVVNGTANGSRFLKTGNHTVKLSAEGYEDYSQSIVVNSAHRSFSVTMTKKMPVLSPVLQRLVENMVYVAGGTFTMGATSEQGSEAYSDEQPAHQVTLSSFSIGKYEVTQEEWEAVMGSNPSAHKGKKRPVEYVNWNDCQEFIKKLNQLTGKMFRLPTEAEWEFAARGGTRSGHYKYSGSNTIDEVAWTSPPMVYHDQYTNNTTHEVGTKRPNELGLYDMSSNVWEW